MAIRISQFDQAATSVLKNWTQGIEDKIKQLEKRGTISKSGSYVLQQLVSTTPPADAWWLTPTHMSYRPLSNPLHGTIVNGLPAIVIDSFIMRVGKLDIINNGGQITTGLQWDTLYFVYYDDIDLSGGVQTYFCDRFKEVALSGDGRLFVGSLRTPLSATSVDTIGSNDGGVGAQSGGHVGRYALTVGAGAVDALGNQPVGAVTQSGGTATDQDWTTCIQARITGDVGGSAQVSASASNFGSREDPDRWFTHLFLKIKTEAIVKTCSGSASNEAGVYAVYYDGKNGTNGTIFRSLSLTGNNVSGTLPAQVDVIQLPDGVNPNNVSVAIVGEGWDDPSVINPRNGELTVRLYCALLEGDY